MFILHFFPLLFLFLLFLLQSDSWIWLFDVGKYPFAAWTRAGLVHWHASKCNRSSCASCYRSFKVCRENGDFKQTLVSDKTSVLPEITWDVEVMVQLIGACSVGGDTAIHSRHRGLHHSQDPHSLRTQTWAQNEKNSGWRELRLITAFFIDFND